MKNSIFVFLFLNTKIAIAINVGKRIYYISFNSNKSLSEIIVVFYNLRNFYHIDFTLVGVCYNFLACNFLHYTFCLVLTFIVMRFFKFMFFFYVLYESLFSLVKLFTCVKNFCFFFKKKTSIYCVVCFYTFHNLIIIKVFTLADFLEFSYFLSLNFLCFYDKKNIEASFLQKIENNSNYSFIPVLLFDSKFLLITLLKRIYSHF